MPVPLSENQQKMQAVVLAMPGYVGQFDPTDAAVLAYLKELVTNERPLTYNDIWLWANEINAFNKLGNAIRDYEAIPDEVATVQITAGTFDPTTKYQLKVDGVVLVDIVGESNATATAKAMRTAWNASSDRFTQNIVATQASNVVTLNPVRTMPVDVVSDTDGGTGTIGSVLVGDPTDPAKPYIKSVIDNIRGMLALLNSGGALQAMRTDLRPFVTNLCGPQRPLAAGDDQLLFGKVDAQVPRWQFEGLRQQSDESMLYHIAQVRIP